LDNFDNDNAKNLASKVLSGQLKNTKLRGLLWKVLLGCLPLDMSIDEWGDVLNIHRKGDK
jgi:hypothetical protein